MTENIHFEADNTVVVQNDFFNDRRERGCRERIRFNERIRRPMLLFELEQRSYAFAAILGHRSRRDRIGPFRTRRVICNTAEHQSSIPIGLLREMCWSYAGPNPQARREVTSYLANATLTPISIGFDGWTVPESNKIEIRNAEVSLDKDKNSITMGSQDLNHLRFFILPDDENSPRRFGFEIEEIDEDESETETEDSSDEDL